MTEPADLYETDFYRWSRLQARELKKLAATRPNAPVDWPRVIEEVGDLGKSELRAIESQLRRIIVHLLKLQHSPAVDPRGGWRSSIVEARVEIHSLLSPTLRRIVSRDLPALYAGARSVAAAQLDAHGESEAANALPDTCPWTPAQLLDPEFWPERSR